MTTYSPFVVPDEYLIPPAQPAITFADDTLTSKLGLDKPAQEESCQCCGRVMLSRRGRPRLPETVLREEKIMDLLSEVPYATKEEIAAELNESHVKVYRELVRLQKHGKIEMQRIHGACQWRVIRNGS